MSKYTTELRYVCEVESGLVDSKGFNDIETILSNSRSKIFNFPYPIFDETYRPVLETKILRHYYTRELCAETVGMWKHFLSVRLNQIMPYYNKLYESETLQFNPLRDTDLTRDHSGEGTKANEYDRTNSETRNDTRTDNLTRTDSFTRTDNLNKTTQDSGTEGESGSDVNKNTRWDTYSDTPQGALTNVQNEQYLTNARKIVDDGTGTTHSNTITFGKKVTESDTGTVQNAGTAKHTGTQQNSGTLSQTVGSTENISTTDEYIEHIVGKSSGASYSKLLTEYRETMLNIDSLIIEDLSDLFFNLW